jgi:undecaprenyl-diphosphatase
LEWSELRLGSDPLTFRHLASHTAGLIREPELEGAAEGPLAFWGDKILASIPATSFYGAAGEACRYSNIGFGILGYGLGKAVGVCTSKESPFPWCLPARGERLRRPSFDPRLLRSGILSATVASRPACRFRLSSFETRTFPRFVGSLTTGVYTSRTMPTWILRLGRFDERLLHAVIVRRRAPLDRLVGLLTRVGDPPVAIVLAGGLALGVVPGLQAAGIEGAFALAFSHLVVQILKRSFSRPRPNLPVGMSSLVLPPDRFSFPSGHAAAGLSIALPLFMSLPLSVGLPVLVLGMAVGLTRCYLGVHYPGDVMAGWILATLAVLLADPILLLLR